MPPVSLFGPLDAVLGDSIEYVLLILVLVNLLTRVLAHRRHVKAAEEGGAEAMSRFLPHAASNALLVLAAFYYLTLHHHAGMVTSVLVLGLFITDFFEFEARKVEARRDVPIERPKGAIAASLLTLAYVAYQSLFFLIAPAWGAVV
ncbi:DUF7313 family protein [Halorhabdus amylolytica]|uniref:DUF7313 family protein n=1 Tax=Halorhabdus amylolytica TaxID=2559573 RepID=UPI0010AB0DF5|nr:hypothetical protein [Halorhabdus amylolytica]